MKRGTQNHPKTKALARRLKIERYAAVGLLDMLWMFAAEFAPAGDVGRYSDEYLADELAWPEKKASTLIQALVAERWLDEHPDHRLIIHDWPEHCEDSVHRKLVRSLELFADGSIPKYSRLSGAERARAEEHYGPMESARRAPDVQGKERTPCAPTVTKPLPSQAKAKPRPAAAAAQQLFPAAAAAIRERFPATDENLIQRVLQSAIAINPAIEDHEILACLPAATRANQQSAALYLDTLPEVVRSWQA